MPIVTIIEADGEQVSVESRSGNSVMHAARAAGVRGIIGECGGSMTCLTCHCFVRNPGAAPLPPPRPDEMAMLDCLVERRAESRLACQIVLTESMDGAVFALPQWQG